MNNMYIVPEPQEKSCSSIEINHRPKVSRGVHDYILVCDKEHRSTKQPERRVYESLATYAILNSFGDSSTFKSLYLSKKRISG